MEVLVLYVLENAVVHSVDALIVGLGYWFIRFSSKRGWGIALLILYAMATVGSMMGGGSGLGLWGIVMAIVGVLLAEFIGRWRVRSL